MQDRARRIINIAFWRWSPEPEVLTETWETRFSRALALGWGRNRGPSGPVRWRAQGGALLEAPVSYPVNAEGNKAAQKHLFLERNVATHAVPRGKNYRFGEAVSPAGQHEPPLALIVRFRSGVN